MDPWISKAETALRTGQPNLAMLYMRRGLSESRGGRSWLASYDLSMALGQFGRAFLRAWQTSGADAANQVAYALAGPAKAAA